MRRISLLSRGITPVCRPQGRYAPIRSSPQLAVAIRSLLSVVGGCSLIVARRVATRALRRSLRRQEWDELTELVASKAKPSEHIDAPTIVRVSANSGRDQSPKAKDIEPRRAQDASEGPVLPNQRDRVVITPCSRFDGAT